MFKRLIILFVLISCFNKENNDVFLNGFKEIKEIPTSENIFKNVNTKSISKENVSYVLLEPINDSEMLYSYGLKYKINENFFLITFTKHYGILNHDTYLCVFDRKKNIITSKLLIDNINTSSCYIDGIIKIKVKHDNIDENKKYVEEIDYKIDDDFLFKKK